MVGFLVFANDRFDQGDHIELVFRIYWLVFFISRFEPCPTTNLTVIFHRKLSVNLGLRLEVNPGLKEAENRNLAGFDTTAVSPIAATAQANYARAPIAEIPATSFSTGSPIHRPVTTSCACLQTTSRRRPIPIVASPLLRSPTASSSGCRFAAF